MYLCWSPHYEKTYYTSHGCACFCFVDNCFCVMFYCLTTKDLTNKKLFRSHAMRSEFCCRMDEGNNPSKNT